VNLIIRLYELIIGSENVTGDGDNAINVRQWIYLT